MVTLPSSAARWPTPATAGGWCSSPKLGLGGLSLVLCLNALMHHPQLWIVYVAAAGMSGLDALQRPSLDALIPRLVDEGDHASGRARSTR